MTSQTQVRRIFEAMDLKKTGRIGILDLENMLIAYDVLDLAHVGNDLVILDVFQSFKTSSVELQFQREVKKQQQQEKTTEDPGKGKKQEDENDESGDDSAANEKRKKKSKSSEGEDEAVEGLDYSSYCEALQMLGVKQRDPEALKDAFCSGGGVNVEMADTKFLNLEEFRKAFLLVADLPQVWMVLKII